MTQQTTPDSQATLQYSLQGLSTEQIQILLESLTLYVQLQLGQLEAVATLHTGSCEPRTPPTNGDRQLALVHLQAAKQLLTGLGPFQSFGLGPKASNSTNIADEMRKVLTQRLSWDQNPYGGFQLNFDTLKQLQHTQESSINITAHEATAPVISSAQRRAELSQVLAKPPRRHLPR